MALLGVPAADAAERSSTKLIGKITKKINLRYKVTEIGFSVLSADFNIELSRSRYKAVSLIKTEGIAGLILQSRWDIVSEGRITSKGISPVRYRSDISTNRGRGAVSVTRKGGKYLISAVPKIRADRKPLLARKLRPNLPDPLSAMISTSLFSGAKPCKGRQRVFDGRQVFDLSYRFVSVVTIKVGSQYSGPAYKCRVKHTPIAGQPREELSKEAKSPSPYHDIWLAKVDLTKNGPTILVPVRINLNSGWGSTIVRLTRSSIGGKPLALASAAR
ncbi:MAG: DUF3108 domain-containing protein [Alphaproteobacteria bacterium]